MNAVFQKSVVVILGLGLAITSTGCMTTPGHGQHIGDFEGDVSFDGYLTEGNSWVRIEAKHPTNGWQTIGWAKSSASSIPYSGEDWHHWSASLQVPASCWVYLGPDDPKGHFKADVRAIQYSNGKPLYTFEAGYGSWFDYSTPLAEMYDEHGNGTQVTIYGNAYIF